MEEMICLVTGAESGLGYAAACGLALEGATVVMVCDNKKQAKKARIKLIGESQNPNIDLFIVNWLSQEDIKAKAHEILNNYRAIDVLLNLSEAYFPIRNLIAHKKARNFAYNIFAPYLFTNELSALLIAADSARVLNLTYESHRLDSINFEDAGLEHTLSIRDAQRQVALARLSWTYELNRRLLGAGVDVHAFSTGARHPVTIQQAPRFLHWAVKFASRFRERTSEEATQALLRLALSDDYDRLSGKYLYRGQIVKSSPITYNQEFNQQLWETCAARTNSSITAYHEIREMLLS
jgi:NAD(P)-dependent dehydrogenase (short-subunit alcohol dehydrogenase family)